jgi:hypothetical protein
MTIYKGGGGLDLSGADRQCQIRQLIDYAGIPPAAQARASKGTRLNPAGEFIRSAPFRVVALLARR